MYTLSIWFPEFSNKFLIHQDLFFKKIQMLPTLLAVMPLAMGTPNKRQEVWQELSEFQKYTEERVY